MDDSFDEQEGLDWRRMFRWGLVGVCVLALLGAALWLGLPRYRSWRSQKALIEAQEAHVAGEFRRQQLFLEQAVQVDPSNLEARRSLAGFYDLGGQVRALGLWRELSQVEPTNMANHLGHVTALLRRGDTAGAAAALESVPETLRTSLDFHRLAASVAAARGDVAELEAHLRGRAQYGDSSEELRIGRLGLDLYSNDAEVRGRSRAELVALARQGPGRIRPLLLLLKSIPAGPGRKAEISGLAEAVLPPKPRSPLFPALPARGLFELLAYMGQQATPDAREAVAYVDWLCSEGLARDAYVWLGGQPQTLREDARMLVARANVALQMRDWRELRRLLSRGVWGVGQEDSLDLAFAARLQRQLGRENNARETWRDALEAAQRTPQALALLERLAGDWDWPEARERALRAILAFSPRDAAAWLRMFKLAELRGETEMAWQVLNDWRRVLPDDPERDDLRVAFGALTQRLEPADKEALLTAASAPGLREEGRLAAAYVFLQRGRTDQALHLLSGVPLSASLSRQGILLRAALLKAAGRREELRLLLSRGTLVGLLPEEKTLIAELQRFASNP